MVSRFMDQYREKLTALIEALPVESFNDCVALLADAYKRNAQVFIMGNGGSAASANHFVCDFGKNAVPGGKRRFRVISLSDNIEKITALGNDIGFEHIFKEQLVNLIQPGDLVISVSASGNSPNIIQALVYAKERGAKVIALAGFDGGQSALLADASIVTYTHSYEQAEDIHLILLHMFVCYFKENPELLD